MLMLMPKQSTSKQVLTPGSSGEYNCCLMPGNAEDVMFNAVGWNVA